jgi:adenylate cyclase
MDELSCCVQNNEGVLVDYVGDELIAMWGAPDSQPAHACMATTAAQEMLGQVRSLGARWETEIGQKFRIGIGINSGIAQVGNIGSKLRFKYGPLGNAVNIASRVQGVTKRMGVPLLVTLETAQALSSDIHYRTLGQVKLVNVSQPVTICEIREATTSEWLQLTQLYERGFKLFTAGNYREACDVLSEILRQFPEDKPTQRLLARAEEIDSGTRDFEDPTVWVMDAK